MTTATRQNKKKALKAKAKSNTGATTLQKERKALIKSLRGSLSWVNYSVDEYLQEKWEETDRENHL